MVRTGAIRSRCLPANSSPPFGRAKNRGSTRWRPPTPTLLPKFRIFFPLLTAMEGWKTYRETTSYEHRSLDTLPGGQFGDFRVIREIGRGGMGVVFEAEELNTWRRVAIKVLPYLKSDARRALFQREASTAARLWHPHIVPVYSFGEHKGLCYYSMRLVRGVALNWVIDRLSSNHGAVAASDVSQGFETPVEGEHHAPTGESPVERPSNFPPGRLPIVAWRIARNSWFEIAQIEAQVADALGYAHANGIVHGDIKPANLLLDSAANAWVTDFGLSRNQSEPLEQASSGMVGTLRYLAPSNCPVMPTCARTYTLWESRSLNCRRVSPPSDAPTSPH